MRGVIVARNRAIQINIYLLTYLLLCAVYCLRVPLFGYFYSLLIKQMNCTIASTAVVRIIVGLLGCMELTATVFKLFVESWPNFVNCKLLPLAFVMVVVALLFGSYSGRGRSGWWSYESSADSTPSTSQQHGWRVRQGRQSGAQLRYVRTSCATQAKMHAHIYGKKMQCNLRHNAYDSHSGMSIEKGHNDSVLALQIGSTGVCYIATHAIERVG